MNAYLRLKDGFECRIDDLQEIRWYTDDGKLHSLAADFPNLEHVYSHREFRFIGRKNVAIVRGSDLQFVAFT